MHSTSHKHSNFWNGWGLFDKVISRIRHLKKKEEKHHDHHWTFVHANGNVHKIKKA